MHIKDPIEQVCLSMLAVPTKVKGGLKVIGHYTKEALDTCAEAGEGASISYSLMAVLSQYPKLQSLYGYGVVGLGTVTALIMEVLESKKAISEKRYHIYRIIKESIAGAAVAAIFTEGFLAEDVQSVAIAAAIVVGLSFSKAVLEILRIQKGHQSKAHKILDYTLGGVYSLLVGAGITDYFFKIWEGFGVEVPDTVALAITGLVAFLTFLSEMPANKLSGEDGKRHCCYTPARGYSSGVYASDINLFLTIFLFDAITSAKHSTDITNLEFSLVMAVAVIGWAYTFYRKFTNDKKEDHDLVEHGGPAEAHAQHNHNDDHHKKDEIQDEHQPLLHQHHQQESTHSETIDHETKGSEEEAHHHDTEAHAFHENTHETQQLIAHEQTQETQDETKTSSCLAKVSSCFQNFWKKNEREMHSKTLVNIVAAQHWDDEQDGRIQIVVGQTQ